MLGELERLLHRNGSEDPLYSSYFLECNTPIELLRRRLSLSFGMQRGPRCRCQLVLNLQSWGKSTCRRPSLNCHNPALRDAKNRPLGRRSFEEQHKLENQMVVVTEHHRANE